MRLPTQNEWLADFLAERADLVTQYWIDDIRSEDVAGYESITDEQLRIEFPPTVDSMIEALRTGDTEGPRMHSLGIIQKRLAAGFRLPDLQMSLHSLEMAVMRLVMNANLGPEKEFEALQVASNLYYMVALIAAAVYEQLREEQQRRFTTTYEFGLALSRNLEMDQVMNVAVAKVAQHVGAESVAILLASESGLDEVRAYHNISPDVVDDLPSICEYLRCDAVDAEDINLGRATHTVPDVRVEGLLVPWSELLTSRGHRAVTWAPLIAKQKRLGVLIVIWSDAHTPSDAEVEFLSAMAGHIASAVQNAILYEEAKAKRELGMLLDASRLFGSTLNTKDILRSIARMAADAARADLAIVFTLARLSQGPCTAFHLRDRRAAGAFRRIVDAVVSEGEASGFESLGREFADGKALLYSSSAEFPGRLGSLADLDASGLVVPLRYKGSLFGAFALVSMVPNAFAESDVGLATGLADLAAVAIENARLYEYERNIAGSLQRSFLPSSLPSIEGYEVAAYYRPAMAEAEIGGDFYDVFAIAGGRISIVIGDVSGKGLNAAIPTVMGKYMIRAYAAENLSPSEVMTRFNRVLLENVPEGMFMTVLYCNLDPKANTLTYVSAGHDPPLLYSATSGGVNEVDIGGVCLGVTDEVQFTETTVHLRPNDALLLYTDGATDVKDGGGRLRIEGLTQLFLRHARGRAEQIVTDVSDGIWHFCHGKQTDDVALVLLKRL